MILKIPVLVSAYIHFMGVVGEVANDPVYTDQVPKLFTENVAKVENGKTIVTGHQQLLDQLENARKYAAPWKMEVLDVVVDKERNSAAVRFTWDSKKVGKHITTAILKFDTDGKITHIVEVYNKLADITH